MECKPSSFGPLTFGFDIGIASVGWCVLGENRIVDLGVRCFDKAETAKEGESLNLARRMARLMRRRLRRRAWRLTKLARLLKREGLITDITTLKQPPGKNFKTPNLWKLRVEALERKLDAEEWARVIYHLCKHRGFHWISRAEEAKAESDSKSEGGKVKKGLAATKRLMEDKRYRTAAEMVLKEFPEAQRNKQGDYGKALSRIALGEELATLFRRQRELDNPKATSVLEQAVLGDGSRKSGLFWAQKPPLSGNDLLKMLGKCTFERAEYRAPKASFTSERHVWLTRLNNLRIIVDGTTRSLNEQERRIALPLPYQQAGDLTYKQLRAVMTKAGLLPDTFRFTGLAYPSASQQADSKTKNPEEEKLVKLPSWQELRKTLEKADLKAEWQKISTNALEGKPELLDRIAWVLSVFKDGEEVERELRALNLPGGEKMIAALETISFDKFHALSLKALCAIVPYMESGLRYDEACQQAGYHHSQLHEPGKDVGRYLPPFYSGRDKDGRLRFNEDMDIPRNPVVLRALNQARKVCNALIRTYGAPYAVHIEMARDLSRPMDERSKVKKAQEEYRERNDKDKALFAREFKPAGAVKGREFEKWQLYREQQCKCAYSIEPIDIHRLFEPGYTEIDHALPYSRSFDDSKNNKVLVLATENRNKGNQTPYEYLDGKSNSERWHRFTVWVENNKSYRQAKRSRLLRKDFDVKASAEFRDRNLNDTRYICKFFKNYVERYLQLAEGSENKRCVVLSGQLTAFLRARWGLIKVRGDSDRHHALDAAVVAACSHSMVKRLSDYSRRKELEKAANAVDMETGEIADPAMLSRLEQHFPAPWEQFRNELLARLSIDDAEKLRAELQRLGTYTDDALATSRPIFVSRAPQRRNSGAAHKDTIYGQTEHLRKQGSVTQKVPLSSLNLKDLDKLIDPQRNEKLYAAIRARLDAHGGKGDKAFPPDNPLLKPSKDGSGNGPVVRTVTMLIDKLSGIPIRGGVAKNDTMLRVDVFRHKKDGKYHLVPVYVHHTVAKELPNRAIVAFKEECDWTVIDGQFVFCFSLHPNDLIKITQKSGEVIFGYYRGCHSGTAALNIALHDRYAFGEKTTSLSWSKKNLGKPIPNDKLGLIEGVGVKMAAIFEKLHVSTLGNIYLAPPEQRRGLA